MARRKDLLLLSELTGDLLHLADPADGWPGLGAIHLDGINVPVAVWVGPIGNSHRGRDGVERRFQNPGSDRPIWVDTQRQPLLLGLWTSDAQVGVASPVVVSADPRRREGRTTRFSVFVSLSALVTAATTGWAEHRNDDGELLRYAHPSEIGSLLLAGELPETTESRETTGNGAVDLEDVIALARSGLTLDEIGAEVGVTRERVRQILRDRAPDVAADRKVLAAKRRKHLAARRRHTEAADRLHRISGELQAKGIDAGDVLENLQRTRIPTVTGDKFGVTKETVIALYNASGFDFPIVERRVAELRYDHEACVSYLRLAAEELAVDHLTAAAYDDFASRQTVTPEAWPSAQTIMKRFDTWTESVEAAGLASVRRSGRSYKQQFPPARCREFVDRYVGETLDNDLRPTLAGFGEWAKSAGGPSVATLRNRLGRWSDTLAGSLRRLER